MRLIGTINNKKHGQEFSFFLGMEGIVNQCETLVNTDWGSPNYGDATCRIWVYDEDQIDKATELFKEFMKNPDDPRYLHQGPYPESFLESSSTLMSEIPTQKVDPKKQFYGMSWNPKAIGWVTLYITLLCIVLFVWGEATTPPIPPSIPTNIVLNPFVEPEIYKELFYDYPYSFEIVDKLIALYGPEKLANPTELPAEGQYLFEEYIHTPYWKGLYEIALLKYWGEYTSPWIFSTPMFEKISQGEVWRLFTPCLLHANVLHILFNLIWFVILAKQMESRLGGGRFFLFILLVGIFSNTSQYLISGSNFIGISGVLCGMFTFIWTRQRYAAWEGYELQPGTFVFIAFFILTMFFIQTASFFLEMFMHVSISPGIANGAHLSGALGGFLLGRLKYFSWNTLS